MPAAARVAGELVRVLMIKFRKGPLAIVSGLAPPYSARSRVVRGRMRSSSSELTRSMASEIRDAVVRRKVVADGDGHDVVDASVWGQQRERQRQ